MKTNFLTSIARTVASTLMPSRINVEKDSLAKAIAKKISNGSITSKTQEKLKTISNYNGLPESPLQAGVEQCTHETSVSELKKQLLEVSFAPARSKISNRHVVDKIRTIVNTVEKRVGFAEDIWNQSYWKNRDGGTADTHSQTNHAILRLGYKPEWNDYRLALQVTNLAQDTELSAYTLHRMRASFHALYRIPLQNDANNTPLTFSDFPDPSNLPDFVDLSVAAEDLRDAYNQLNSFHSKGIRIRIECLLMELDQILQSAFDALLSRHEELVAQPEDATAELDAIRKWLGALELPNEPLINVAPTAERAAEIELIENFSDAMDMDADLDAVSEADSEDSHITESSSDDEKSSIHLAPRLSEYAQQDSIGSASDLDSVNAQWEREIGPDTGPIATSTVDASLAKANLLTLFKLAMGIQRHQSEDAVEYETRSGLLLVAMGRAFVRDLGFRLPVADGRKEHVLTDFPDALDMQTFRSIRELNSELNLMRSQMRHVDDSEFKPRLIDRVESFYPVIKSAEHFWTARLLDLQQRDAAGESVKEEIHIARKWLGSHDPVFGRDVTPSSIIGADALTDAGVRNAGEIAGAVDEADGGPRRTSQASHLFGQAAAEQTQEKRQTSATDPVSRGYAWMTALR